MQTYSRRALLGTGLVAAGGLFVERTASAQASSDFVLDHAGREMVRLHTRGHLARASTLALAAANLRLLAAHPHVGSIHQSLHGLNIDAAAVEQSLIHLHRSLRARHGYAGTVQDLRNLGIDAPPDVMPSVLKDMKAGNAALMLTKAANKLEELSLRFDTTGLNSPVRFKEQMFEPLMQQVWDPGEGVEPCTTLAVIQFGLFAIAIVLSMGGAGVVIGGIFAGMGLILQIIRWGGC